MLRLAGSLRLCDRRVQSSSCRTSFAEQRTRESLAAGLGERLRVASGSERVKEKDRSPARIHVMSAPRPVEAHPRLAVVRPTQRTRNRCLPPVALPGDQTRLPAGGRHEDHSRAVTGVLPVCEQRLVIRRQPNSAPLRRHVRRLEWTNNEGPAGRRSPLDGRVGMSCVGAPAGAEIASPIALSGGLTRASGGLPTPTPAADSLRAGRPELRDLGLDRVAGLFPTAAARGGEGQDYDEEPAHLRRLSHPRVTPP
jgi:hypothetical protein